LVFSNSFHTERYNKTVITLRAVTYKGRPSK
jgi:hypothetical protein